MRTKAQKKFAKTLRGKFIQQRRDAKKQNVPWEFTYDEWLDRLSDRGRWRYGNHSEHYRMERLDKQGPWSFANTRMRKAKARRLYP